MWQQVIAGLLVIAAAIYAVRALGPRRWRRKSSADGAKGTGAGPCGCDKGGGGCP